MRHEGVVRVRWTRAELTAIREAIEVTPNFEGRLEVRDLLRDAFRSHRGGDISFEHSLAERLGSRLVPIDAPTAMARAKLLLAVRGPRKRSAALNARPRRPVFSGAHGTAVRPPVPVPVPAPVAEPIAASAAA
jgi:hypothetical protein